MFKGRKDIVVAIEENIINSTQQPALLLYGRRRIVVLFSGGHRFEELHVVNWSDYLINVKTLELSFLGER